MLRNFVMLRTVRLVGRPETRNKLQGLNGRRRNNYVEAELRLIWEEEGEAGTKSSALGYSPFAFTLIFMPFSIYIPVILRYTELFASKRTSCAKMSHDLSPLK